MRTRRSVLASLALPLAAALAGLAACNSVRPEVDEVPRDLRGRWFLVELEGLDLAALDEAGVRRPEILIGTEGEVSGFGGVNKFGSTLDLEVLGARRFALSRITSTMKAGPPEAMEAESKFLQALQDARVYRVRDGERLELSDLSPDDPDKPGELILALGRKP